MDTLFVPSVLEESVSDDDLQTATHTARQEIEARLGKKCGSRLWPRGWLRKVSAEEFIAWFREIVIHEPGAGNVALLFARVILSIIGEAKSLSEGRKKAIADLCSVINERPLPTALWADFVKDHLDNPAVIGRVLTCCVQNTAFTFTSRIQEHIGQCYEYLLLTGNEPILVFGYSTTIVATLRGLPSKVTRSLKVLTPKQSLPDRKDSDGTLLQQSIGGIISVDVLEDRDAKTRLRRGHIGLLLMGAKVIGKRETGHLEVVNSSYAHDYTTLASQSGIPTVVITGSYKLWPTREYEKYRPEIARYNRNSIVSGEHVTWILTEDRLFPQEKFRSVYEKWFTYDGIPLASIRECLRGKKIGSHK